MFSTRLPSAQRLARLPKNISATLFITFFCSLILQACSKKNEVEPGAQVLNISVGASPQSLDPHVATGNPESKILSGLGETLVRLDLQTTTVIPGIAEQWTVSDDGLRYEFNLRKNAKWSNGDPITASDFVFTWQRALAPTVGWQYANDYYFIKGAKAYNLGESDEPASLGVHAIDTHTVIFELETPYPLFLKQLTSERMAPIHKKSIELRGAIDDINTNWTHAGNYVSSGAFYLAEWKINKILVLKKNPYYWNATNVTLDTIRFHPIEPEAAEERAFRSGQIDLIYSGRIPVEKFTYYREKHPDQLVIFPSFASYFYLFNITKPPFDNLKVRQAFAHAIDRESIVKNITKAGEKIGTSLNPYVEFYSEQIQAPQFSIDKAQKFLDEAGYPNGEGFPEVSLLYNSSDMHKKVALAIQQMWKTTLGVNVALENQEWKVYLRTRQSLDYSIARAGSISDIADPSDFIDSYRSNHGMNHTGWSNAEFDTLTLEASSTINQQTRYVLLAKAESILLSELPILPIYQYSDSYLKKEYVKGLQFNALGRINYNDIYIER